jgi:DNA-directed RNA polymerase II subunit RPB1
VNGILSTGIQAINEARELSYVGNWFIDFRNQTPMIGLFQDSLTGASELTRSNIKINKWHAMFLLGQTNNKLLSNISLKENKIYSGRDLISFFIPSDINIKNKKPSIYLKQYANLMNEFDKNDIVINIENGELKTGILDSATINQNRENSLFHMMYNHKGVKFTINSLYEMQHLIHKFIYIHGLTTGMKDIIANENIIKEIKRKNANIIYTANNITDKLDKGELIPPINLTLKDYYESQQMQSLNISDDIIQYILSDMNFNDNGLAKLVLSGSKGKINHIIQINGIIGAQQVKGNRAKMNFGIGRTSPYFFRYDMSPQSRGYIENSYIEGIDSSTFMFACYEGRQAMVNNAMNTMVAGYQNRICVKNLESIIVNNLFSSSKHNAMVQPLYGETGFDFRSLMHVKFTTIMLSDKEFKNKYKIDISKFDSKFRNNKNIELLNKEFNQLEIDRNLYRKIFLKLERTSMDSYLFSDVVLLPVKFNDLLENISNIHNDLKDKDILDPSYAINKVSEFCNNLPYIYTNENIKNKKAKMPTHINVAVNLLKQVTRSYLCTYNLLKYGINDTMLNILLDKIMIRLKKSLVDYGTPVGIIAAQASAEPLTQDILNSKHKSGIGGTTKTDILDRIQEILGAKSTEKLKNPSMLIRVLPEYENDEIKMQELSNIIKEVKLQNFIDDIQIFFEEFAKPKHPDYVYESKYIDKYVEHTISNIDINSFIKWCIRFSINRNNLIFKNITLEEIILALEKKHKNITFVYSPQNSNIIFIRCYIKYDYFKKNINFEMNILQEIKNILLNTIIRGVNGILSTKVSDIMISEINEDKIIIKKKIFVISTIGTNLESILDLDFVDKEKTQTDSITEMEELFGIDCARNKIINEIMYSMSAASRIHSGIFADEMTYTGVITPISRTGLLKREDNNIWLNASFEGPVQAFRNACLSGKKTYVQGVSSPIVMGEPPIVGTRYNKIVNNEIFIKDYYKNLQSNIDELI